MDSIFEKASAWQENKLPFVIYLKPNSNKLQGIFQKSDSLYSIKDFTESGFAFVSFTGNEKILIPKHDSIIISETLVNHNFIAKKDIELTFNNDIKNSFEQLVTKAIEQINQNKLDKVVLSRKETFKLDNFQFEIILKKLIKFYPNTFKYCFYHPKIGFWLGATPEQLLQVQDNILQTVALAGTQLSNTNNTYTWETKEQDEQKIVTDYIFDNLQNFSSNLSATIPYTINAGSIAHLKTDISAVLNDNCDFGALLKKMHPTPAVCGLPKIKSKNFILENENYDRKFYAGYLGELNLKTTKNVDLFVNLRCMSFDEGLANIYVGCGITKNSNPEKEFFETLNKSKTIKMVL